VPNQRDTKRNHLFFHQTTKRQQPNRLEKETSQLQYTDKTTEQQQLSITTKTTISPCFPLLLTPKSIFLNGISIEILNAFDPLKDPLKLVSHTIQATANGKLYPHTLVFVITSNQPSNHVVKSIKKTI
jgi:hypothetical protein